MEYIERAIEDIVEKSAKTFKTVLITGARQTGKSTLIKHQYSDIKEVTFDGKMLVHSSAAKESQLFMYKKAYGCM